MNVGQVSPGRLGEFPDTGQCQELQELQVLPLQGWDEGEVIKALALGVKFKRALTNPVIKTSTIFFLLLHYILN